MGKKNVFVLIIYCMLIYCVIASVILILYCNPTYKEREMIKKDSFHLKVEESFLTSYNDKNELISKDQTFLLIELDTDVNYNDLILKINGDFYSNNNEYKNYFRDITDNPLIFVIDNKNLGNEMILYYETKENILTKNYRILINPYNLNDTNDMETLNIGDEIIIGSIKTKINSYSIANKYIISYKKKNKKINKIINEQNRDILKLEFNNNDNIEKITDYAKIKYIINNQLYEDYIDVIDKGSNILYLSINDNIKTSSDIYLEFVSRNKTLHYYLKKKLN